MRRSVQLHLGSLAASQLSFRASVWDATSALSPSASLRQSAELSSVSFPLSTQPVRFVSRLSLCLLELDARYELCVEGARRQPNSFAANGALHPSQHFLTYAELPARDECGAATEFVQWRRRASELRARGWAYCHDVAGSTPAVDWRVERFNSIARDQARKNFTPLSVHSGATDGGVDSAGESGIAQLRARLLKETEGKGVQLVLGNARTQLDWSPSTSGGTPDASGSLAALLRCLCLVFGALRRGGDFAFLLTGAEQLLSSRLLHELLRALSVRFTLLSLHRCAVSVGVYGSGEVWLVGKGFVAGHASDDSARLRAACTQLLADAAEPTAAKPLPDAALPFEQRGAVDDKQARLLSLNVQSMRDQSASRCQHTASTRLVARCRLHGRTAPRHTFLQLVNTDSVLCVLVSCERCRRVLSGVLHAAACLCLTDTPLPLSSGHVSVSPFRPPSARSHCQRLLASWGIQFAF